MPDGGISLMIALGMSAATAATTAAVLTAVSLALTVGSLIYQLTQSNKSPSDNSRRGLELTAEGQPQYMPIVYGRAKVGGLRVWHATKSNFVYTDTNAQRTILTNGTPTTAQTLTIAGVASFALNDTVELNSDGVIRKVMEATSGPNLAVTPGVSTPLTTVSVKKNGVLLAGVTATSTSSTIDIPYVNADGEEMSLSYEFQGYTGGQLITDHSGDSNSFMFFQQAICVGPINRVLDVLIEESRFIDDAAFSSSVGNAAYNNDADPAAAMRIDIHYAGSEADAITELNFSNRSAATFDGLAYASAVIRLDDKAPQFGSVPNFQFFLEGRLVRGFTGNTLNVTPTYSNNAVLCLLDYMLLPTPYGGAVEAYEIDMASFAEAATIAGEVMLPNAKVGGKFYQTTDGFGSTSTIDVKRYECNVIVDPTKPVRENIEAMLSTMPDARLVWSAGQYHLRLRVPDNAGIIALEGVLTDDDIELRQSVDIAYPSLSDRANIVQVRFHNETEDFEEDSVTWPPKYDRDYIRLGGGYAYSLGDSGYGAGAVGDLLNDYGVWRGISSPGTAEFTFLFVVRKGPLDTYTLEFAADNSGSYSLQEYNPDTAAVVGAAIAGTATYPNLHTNSGLSLGSALADTCYRLHITATDGSGDSGNLAAVGLTIQTASTTVFTTRQEAYVVATRISETSALYDEFVLEDGRELRQEVLNENITDRIHALEKAKALLWASRTAVALSLKYVVQESIYEPGDYIAIASETLHDILSPGPAYTVGATGYPALEFIPYAPPIILATDTAGELATKRNNAVAAWRADITTAITTYVSNMDMTSDEKTAERARIARFYPFIVRVDTAELDANNASCSLKTTKYDARQLLWSTDNDSYV